MFLLTKSLDVGPKAKLIAVQFPVGFSNLTKYFNLTIYQFPVLWRSDIWHRYTVNILRPTGFRLLLSNKCILVPYRMKHIPEHLATIRNGRPEMSF